MPFNSTTFNTNMLVSYLSNTTEGVHINKLLFFPFSSRKHNSIDFQCSEEDDTVPEADSKPVTTNSVDSSNPVANDRDKNTRRNDEEMEDSEDYSTDEDEIVALPPHPPTSTSTTNNTVTTAPTTKKPFTPPTRSTSSREAERSTTTTSPTNYRLVLFWGNVAGKPVTFQKKRGKYFFKYKTNGIWRVKFAHNEVPTNG